MRYVQLTPTGIVLAGTTTEPSDPGPDDDGNYWMAIADDHPVTIGEPLGPRPELDGQETFVL